jgi:hypothetical protein
MAANNIVLLRFDLEAGVFLGDFSTAGSRAGRLSILLA